MKLKRIACLALAVMMMAVMAISTSAATLSIDYKPSSVKTGATKDATAEQLNAAYAHNVVLDAYNYTSSSNLMVCGIPQNAVGVGDDVVNNTDLAATDEESLKKIAKLDLSYVAYKFEADEGQVINTVKVNIKGLMKPFDASAAKNHQIGVYVTVDPTVAINSDTKVMDVTKLTLAHVYKNTGGQDFRSNGLDADISAAVASLGEQKTVYVVLALFNPWSNPSASNWGTGYDCTNNRLNVINIVATQKAATPAPETQAPATQAPATQAPVASDDVTVPPEGDTALISALALVLVSGMAVAVVSRKKK